MLKKFCFGFAEKLIELLLHWLSNEETKKHVIILYTRRASIRQLKELPPPLFPSTVSDFTAACINVLYQLGAEAEDINNALGIICEYLTPSMADALLRSYNVDAKVLTAKTAPTKRKADWEQSLEVYCKTKNL